MKKNYALLLFLVYLFGNCESILAKFFTSENYLIVEVSILFLEARKAGIIMAINNYSKPGQIDLLKIHYLQKFLQNVEKELAYKIRMRETMRNEPRLQLDENYNDQIRAINNECAVKKSIFRNRFHEQGRSAECYGNYLSKL